jgi:hypothetical protein
VHSLRIANSHLTWELRFRLDIQVMPSGSAGGRCPCGTVLRGTRDADHALVCPKHSGVRTLRHDHLNRVWCGEARCAGVATAVEPKLRAQQMQPGVRRHAQVREDARGDALLAMRNGMLVLDVNIVHALAVAFLEGTVATGSSADVAGAAAAIGEKDKEDKYSRDIDENTNPARKLRENKRESQNATTTYRGLLAHVQQSQAGPVSPQLRHVQDAR